MATWQSDRVSLRFRISLRTRNIIEVGLGAEEIPPRGVWTRVIEMGLFFEGANRGPGALSGCRLLIFMGSRVR